MYHELTTNPKRAEAWYFFFNEFLPKHPEFTRKDLEMGIMNKFRSHSEKHFGLDSKMNPIIARKLLECYLESKAFGSLNLLRQLKSETDCYYQVVSAET